MEGNLAGPDLSCPGVSLQTPPLREKSYAALFGAPRRFVGTGTQRFTLLPYRKMYWG